MGIILLDGSPVECPPGAVIGDLLPGLDPGLCVAVIRPGLVSRSETRQFLIKTTAGEIVIEIPGTETMIEWSDLPSGLTVRWQDRISVSFGPFFSEFNPSRHPSRYERGDLILGCGGYDPSQSMLVFARRTHSADHGAAADGGRLGKVVSGRGVVDRLGQGDRILGIEPVLSFAESVDAFTTTDMLYPVSDGMQIVSHLKIEAQGYSRSTGKYSSEVAESVEYLLLALRTGTFTCGQSVSTHIRNDILAGTEVPYEMGAARREGAVLMRTSGKKMGSVYIYTEDLPRSMAHTLVGQVVQGIEIARVAKAGDRFSVLVTPAKFDLVGKPLEEAVARAREHGVSLTPDREGEGRMVISQEPPTTLDVLADGKVSVHTVPIAQVIDITLDDSAAPDTCRIFREITGLKYHPVGMIPLFFAFDDVYLFQTHIPKTTNVKPENTPDDEVNAGVLAMTNESRKGVGMVGVRTSDNSEFGPTSEPFSGTNVIGRIIDLYKLAALKEGDLVYFREVMK
jgi:putative methanogenesis marker protein 3